MDTLISAAGVVGLAQLISQNTEALLSQWRQAVRALPSAEHLDVPTLNEIVIAQDAPGAPSAP